MVSAFKVDLLKVETESENLTGFKNQESGGNQIHYLLPVSQ